MGGRGRGRGRGSGWVQYFVQYEAGGRLSQIARQSLGMLGTNTNINAL